MNRQEIIRGIINSIRRHRQYAEDLRDSDYEAALKDSQFRALDTRRRELIIKLAQAESGQAAVLQAEYDAVLNKLDTVTKRLKLNPFKVGYNCALCGDNGYIEGKLCSCARKMLFDKLKSISGVGHGAPYAFDMHNKALFAGLPQEKTINVLYGKLKSYAKIFPDMKYNNIILSGGIGTGKTFALSAFSNAVLNRGFMTLYITAFEMHEAFLRYHTAPYDEKALHIDNLLNADLLVIDDLGTEPVFRNVTLEYLYLIISERMRNSRPILLSTNLDPELLMSRYGERIFSRLLDKNNSRIFNIDGDDLRFIRK
ncbi:MAG: ATP-binding protein [Christensenellales bacterium]